MSNVLEFLQALSPKGPAVRQARRLVERVLDIRPCSLQAIPGIWYAEIEPWRKNVDDFDRLLLGLLGKRKIGLHFSDGNWEMTVEQDPNLDALRIGSFGELHYVAINQEEALPTVLKMFPRWAGAARNFLIVIDREHKEVKRIEAAQEFTGAQMAIKGKPGSPVFFRSHWLLNNPIPLFNILDFFRAEKIIPFVKFGLIYQSTWHQELGKEELYNFYLMLFAVANGLRMLEALEQVESQGV